MSFAGQDYAHARFLGVYEVLAREDTGTVKWPKDFLYPDMTLGKFRYRLKRVSGFEDLEQRVIIDWGGSRSWHQWLKPKEVIEVLPRGYVKAFPGYEEFILSFSELVTIVGNPTANREWYRMLSAVAGIYLVTDGVTGKQYVGSAYGAEGIWGRWSAYAATGHGDNAMLRELLGPKNEYAKNFSFTLLRTLPRTLTRDEVLRLEANFKRKLGSRAYGLNAN